MPVVPEETRIGAPISGARQFIAIGLNYRKHAAESGMPIPKDPLVFNKAITCIQGPDDDLAQPEGSKTMDWEAELGFVVCVKAQRVSRGDALAASSRRATVLCTYGVPAPRRGRSSEEAAPLAIISEPSDRKSSDDGAGEP